MTDTLREKLSSLESVTCTPCAYACLEDFKWLCPKEIDQILNLIKEELNELTVIGDEVLFEELVKYHTELCTSNPIQMPNQTEAIRRCINRQFSHTIKELKDKLNQ